jgi:hypothetical protein
LCEYWIILNGTLGIRVYKYWLARLSAYSHLDYHLPTWPQPIPLKCAFKSSKSLPLHDWICPLQLYVIADPRALAEKPFPDALHRTTLLTRVLCFLAFGRPGLEDHWKSLQSDQTFETVRSKSCSILASTITTVSCSTPRNSELTDLFRKRQASCSLQVLFSSVRVLLCHTLTIHHLLLIVYSLYRSCSPWSRCWHPARAWYAGCTPIGSGLKKQVFIIMAILIAPADLNMISNSSRVATSSCPTCCQ